MASLMFRQLCRRLCTAGSKGGNGSKKTGPKTGKPSSAGEFRNPWYVLTEEMKNIFSRDSKEQIDPLPIPRETDILVIGGGAIGSSVAYWLKQRNPNGFDLAVVERDSSYTQAATVLSVGGLRQQFSLEENIEMSLFTADFIRNIKEHLSIYGVEPPDVQFNPQGYLFLATEKGEETLHANHKIQTELGAKVQIMTSSELKEKFPWLNTEDITCGSYGLENEGWFDPWLMLTALRSKATSLGAEYINGEIVGFKISNTVGLNQSGTASKRLTLDEAMVKHENGEVYPMKFACLVNCAGPWSGQVGALAGIGTGEGALSVPIPVEPRKRFVYVLHCPEGPGLETPMVIDPSGVYFRREGLGGHYICGVSPETDDEEPDHSNLNIDYDYFSDRIWPVLAHRSTGFKALKVEGSSEQEGIETNYYHKNVVPTLVHRIPSMQSAEVKSAWAGYYDYNYYDQNLIIGNHPYHRNFMIATGCSGHGIQQAPAIGRAIMELIIDDEFQTIDMKNLSFDRILDDAPMFEQNIV